MKFLSTTFLILAVSACAANDDYPFAVRHVASFEQPWAMAFLPDGRLLVTEKKGSLRVATREGDVSAPIEGVPEVAYGGQGGFGDVALHPDFANNSIVYISYAEAGNGNTRGAAIAKAELALTDDGGALQNLAVIWRQVPKVTGRNHYGHRLLFADDGTLFVSSGERNKRKPAQNLASNLGKILRLNDDGSPAAGNPFADRRGVAAEVWSLGHRNPLGIALDADGQLWNIEMGPRGGDELNRVIKGRNYGWPEVSFGNNYGGTDIPDHDTRPEFEMPKVWWNPVISPGGFIIYTGELFADWHANGFIAGLSSMSLVRIEFEGSSAREAERFKMGKRIRAVKQGPDGAIWLLEDGRRGRLLELTPR